MSNHKQWEVAYEARPRKRHAFCHLKLIESERCGLSARSFSASRARELHCTGSVEPNLGANVVDTGDSELSGRQSACPFLAGAKKASLAPEWFWRKASREAPAHTDRFAVGTILSELVCGQAPFNEPDGPSWMTSPLSYDPPDIRTRNPAVAPTLAAVVMRALLHNLTLLDKIVPTAYLSDSPLFGGRPDRCCA